MSIDELLDKLDPAVMRSGKFESKLSFHERCGILALYERGVSRQLLAAAFGINRRTVTHITNPHSPHYKSVRRELERMGNTKDFAAKYVTEAMIEKVNEAKDHPDVGKSDRELRGNAEPLAGRPNPSADGKAGINPIKTDNVGYTHRVEIRHIVHPDSEAEGWFWRDLDGDMPDTWQGDRDGAPFTTSKLAYDWAEENIVDV